MQHLNAQLALGQPIDLSQHAQTVSAKVRVASRLGLQRRARDVLARHPSRSCLRAASSNGRTSAAKAFDRLVADIDLGGSDRLSAIERTLVEGFAGTAVTLQHLNTQLALGQPIDLSQHAQAVSAMVRVATADQAQDPSSVLLAFIGREDVAEDLGANRFDGDSVRSSREQQGLLLVSRFVG